MFIAFKTATTPPLKGPVACSSLSRQTAIRSLLARIAPHGPFGWDETRKDKLKPVESSMFSQTEGQLFFPQKQKLKLEAEQRLQTERKREGNPGGRKKTCCTPK